MLDAPEAPLPPMVPPRPAHERPVIDYDREYGTAHAHRLLEILRGAA